MPVIIPSSFAPGSATVLAHDTSRLNLMPERGLDEAPVRHTSSMSGGDDLEILSIKKANIGKKKKSNGCQSGSASPVSGGSEDTEDGKDWTL